MQVCMRHHNYDDVIDQTVAETGGDLMVFKIAETLLYSFGTTRKRHMVVFKVAQNLAWIE